MLVLVWIILSARTHHGCCRHGLAGSILSVERISRAGFRVLWVSGRGESAVVAC